jgi:hypothetical protein
MPDQTTEALIDAISTLANATYMASGSITSPQGQADFQKQMNQVVHALSRAKAAALEADRS